MPYDCTRGAAQNPERYKAGTTPPSKYAIAPVSSGVFDDVSSKIPSQLESAAFTSLQEAQLRRAKVLVAKVKAKGLATVMDASEYE